MVIVALKEQVVLTVVARCHADLLGLVVVDAGVEHVVPVPC